jgi:cytochrome bd ubiquinol oxidase subunit I
VPPADRPPVKPVFFAFRVMVGIGVLMLSVVIWSAIQWRRGKLTQSRALLRAWSIMTPSGFVAILAGWYTTEIGRQPYVIYGLMRTEEAATPLSPASVATSLAVFLSIYLFVFIAGTYYLLKLLRKGPQPVEDAMRHPEDKTPSRPLSVPEEAVES